MCFFELFGTCRNHLKRFSTVRWRLLPLLIVLAFSSPTCAWNRVAHMETALFSYQHLSPDIRERIFVILGNHPNYSLWRQDFDSLASKTPRTIDVGTYIFLRASIWPDEIRAGSSAFNHPKWHFVTYPLEPPNFPERPALFSGENIFQGLDVSRAVISDARSSPSDRAISLSWLVHLIGDIHDPLHCATFINEIFPAPVGDRSGNAFYIRANQPFPISLHSFWDSLGGTSTDLQLISDGVVEAEKRYPRNQMTELRVCSEPTCWSMESRKHAIRDVYLDGKLVGASTPDAAPRVPSSYTSRAKNIAWRRISLAGYRLADELTELLRTRTDGEEK